MYIRANVTMQLDKYVTFISDTDKIDILPSEHGFYLLTNKDMKLISKAIVDEDKVLEKAGKLHYTEPVWTRTFILYSDTNNDQDICCIADEQLFMQVCTDNKIVPLIIPYNCIYALKNPEVFVNNPDYIAVDTSNW